jgi:hypothetical protein
MVNILNTSELKNTLSKLSPDAKPLWGKMTPQHVVEHLTGIVKVSSGKKIVQQFLTKEEGEALKSKLIYGDAELVAGIKSPLLGDEPPALIHANMNDALEELFSEISYFENYYKGNPDATHTHPRMGELKFSEWLVIQNKHFAHHFRQYGLI